MRITIHPLSLALGAAAIAAVFTLTSQTIPPAQTTWPPPKSVIVNVFEEPAVAPPVPGNGTLTVLTVPDDRWLTVTSISAAGNSILRWGELTSTGSLTIKGFVTQEFGMDSGRGAPEGTPISAGGPVGWTFAPGSSVVLVNPNQQPQGVNWYSLIGYYSRN